MELINPDKPFVFGKDFFKLHQQKLLKFSNSTIGRKIFCIDGKKSDVGSGKIIKIEPNSITWREGQRYKTEFRTHNKFSKRIYYAFRPVWYLLHAWDTLFANNFKPEWNLGFDTLTVYPDPHTETSTVDGRAVRNNASTETLAVLRAGAGTSGEPSAANDLSPALVASSTTDQYQILTRGIRLFDTSSIPDVNNIDSAVFSEYVTAKSNGLGGEASVNSAIVLVASTPNTNTDIVAGDYGQLGSVEFGRSDTQANLTTSAYNGITLNASGLAAISKTGISKFGTRLGWDFDNTTTGLTWSSGQIQGVNVNHAETALTTTDPKLVVEHSAPITTSTTTSTSSSTTTTSTSTSSTTSTSSSTTTTSTSTSSSTSTSTTTTQSLTTSTTTSTTSVSTSTSITTSTSSSTSSSSSSSTTTSTIGELTFFIENTENLLFIVDHPGEN